MALAYPEEDTGEGPESSPDMGAGGGDEDYAKAGRAIRHAIADGDDAGIAQAICDLIDIHTSAEPGEPAPKEKPNLAALLLMKKKGK